MDLDLISRLRKRMELEKEQADRELDALRFSRRNDHAGKRGFKRSACKATKRGSSRRFATQGPTAPETGLGLKQNAN
jgi:hypothetical protein